MAKGQFNKAVTNAAWATKGYNCARARSGPLSKRCSKRYSNRMRRRLDEAVVREALKEGEHLDNNPAYIEDWCAYNAHDSHYHVLLYVNTAARELYALIEEPGDGFGALGSNWQATQQVFTTRDEAEAAIAAWKANMLTEGWTWDYSHAPRF